MKKLFYLAAFVILFMACSDDEPDPRDKFIGDYYGMAQTKIYIDDELKRDYVIEKRLTIQKGDTPDELLIDSKYKANISGEGYLITSGQYRYDDYDNGTALKVYVSGLATRNTETGAITQMFIETATDNGTPAKLVEHCVFEK